MDDLKHVAGVYTLKTQDEVLQGFMDYEALNSPLRRSYLAVPMQ